MPDISEILARPDVIRFVDDLVYQAAKSAGVSDTHAKRIALGLRSRLEAGEPVDQLVAFASAIRNAALDDAAKVVAWDADRDAIREIRAHPPLLRPSNYGKGPTKY